VSGYYAEGHSCPLATGMYPCAHRGHAGHSCLLTSGLQIGVVAVESRWTEAQGVVLGDGKRKGKRRVGRGEEIDNIVCGRTCLLRSTERIQSE
jgi:hypothetical protein